MLVQALRTAARANTSGIERDRVRTNEIRNGIGINQEAFYYHYLRGPATEQRAECP
jgi:hypothetical protein